MKNSGRNNRFAGYEPDLEGAVFEFRKANYPDRDQGAIVGDWRWMLVASAKRLKATPLVWLYVKGDRVVAHQGAIAVDLCVGDSTVLSGWFVETMASDSVRGTAIGPMLIKKAQEDLPVSLSLGQNEQMRQIQFALGWERIGSLKKYVFICGYKMSLRNKLPPILAQSAALLLGFSGRWRARRALKDAQSKFNASRVVRFTEEHDQLWAQMKLGLKCTVARDASYMNWKYIDCPETSFEALDIWRDQSLRGTVVIKIVESSDVYPYVRGAIVDVIVPLTDAEVTLALLAHAVTRLQEAGAQTVVCQASNPAFEGHLRLFGFQYRHDGHQFLVSIRGEKEELIREDIRNPDDWFLTLGDSDADRYPD